MSEEQLRYPMGNNWLCQKEAHIEGPAGAADEISIMQVPRRDSQHILKAWIIYAPGQTSLTNWFILSIIDLRPLDDNDDIVIHNELVTHEIMLYALAPTNTFDPVNMNTWKMLIPLNYVKQVVLPDDDAALRLLEVLTQKVCLGELWAEPPLSMQVQPWENVVMVECARLRGDIE